MAESKKVLFDSDSDSSSSSSSSSSHSSKEEKSRQKKKKESKGVSFSINTKFAKEYQSRKQREELAKERELYGNSGSSSDETSSDEDEDGDLLTAKLDVDILKTINALRTKDDKIYDSSVRFFKGSDEESSDKEDEDENTKKKKSKPKRFKDVLREQTLEKMKEEEEGDVGGKKKAREKTSRLEYDEQQQELRKAFIEKKDDSDDSDDEDDFLVIKKRHDNDEDDSETKQQYDQELKNLEASLRKSSSTEADNKHQLVDPRGEVEDGEKFLLNFIKNKTWIDKSEVDFSDSDSDAESLQELEKSDDFEARYNFRFEEAAGGSGADHSIQGYARSQTMNTLRRKDETRRDKRLARKERKAAERKAKEEKLRRLKNAKREEMEQKMKEVKAVLGGTAVEKEGSEGLEGLKDAPIDEAAIMKLLEGDFDPEKFEKSMQEAFGDEFYEKEETEWKTDEDVQEALMKDGEVEYMDAEEEEDLGKPQQQSSVTHDQHAEEYDEEDEYDGDAEEETELEKKVRAKMMDKLYELDYEDIVGGMPTRFKYREVEANNYGLSTHEILLARDSTLKQFVSLKKMVPYREEEEYHVTSRKRRKFREMLQQDVEDAERRMKEQGTTINDNHDNGDNESGETKKKKRRRMKKGTAKDKDSKAKDKGKANEHENEDVEKGVDDATGGKKKRRRKKKGKKISNAAIGESKEDKPASKTPDTHLEPPKKPAEDTSINTADPKESKNAEKKKRKKKRKKVSVEGVSAARLASYDL